METVNTSPPIIPVGQEPPPLHRPPSPARHQGDQGHQGKAKGKAGRRKAGDRFAVLNAFVDFTAGGLSRNEILVWLALYRDTRNGTARTSQADLARRAGVSDRTVRNALGRLAKKGLVRTVYRGGIGRGASAYRVYAVPPNDSGNDCFRL
jgi:predicted DNA-binding transcriptional regulator